MIIAISRTDENKWMRLHGDFPVEREVLNGYILFDLDAQSLEEGVALAKKRREQVLKDRWSDDC